MLWAALAQSESGTGDCLSGLSEEGWGNCTDGVQAGRMYGVEGRNEGLEWRTCMTPHLESTDVGLRCGHVEGYGGTLGEDSDRVIDKLSPWDPQLVIWVGFWFLT